ncbi:MAG: TrmH family RNA methyltransferase [Trueperaceae bacterium]
MIPSLGGLPRIDSASNPRIKALVRLRRRRERDRGGLTLVEGAREAIRAVQAGWTIEAAYLTPELFSAEGPEAADAIVSAKVPTWIASRTAFERASLRQGPDGVLLVVRPPAPSLHDLSLGQAALLLIVVGAEKPGNLGALLRSADAAGADALIACGEGGTDAWNPAVIRSSMGSAFRVPFVSGDDASVRAWLAEHGVALVAAAPEAERSLWDASLRGPVAIALGAEHEGLSAAWLEAASQRVRVPMDASRTADSLNVSVTGALFAFEALRQRRNGGA